MTAYFLPRNPRGIVSVRAGAGAASVLHDLRAAWNEFQAANDQRVRALEAGLSDLTCRAAAFEIGGTRGADAGEGVPLADVNAALRTFIKSGDESPLAELRVRASMSVGSAPDGGYTVTPHLSSAITKIIWESSPIRRLARVVSVNSDSFEEPVDRDEAGAEWVAEKAARPATDTPQIGMWRIPVHEVYAMPRVTQKLLDDSAWDIAGWLAGKVADKFARAEATAFVVGNGSLRPRGFLTYPTSTDDDASRAWGTVQHVNTGSSGSFGDAPNGSDKLIDLVYSLKSGYRSGAVFLMNRKTAGVVRKLKDSEGRYVWQPTLQAGEPDLLLGFPVHYAEDMPDIAANSLSVAFGNFRAAYTVVDRTGIRMLRDPYSAKPHVDFYTWRRVGGALTNSEAVKLLRFGT